MASLDSQKSPNHSDEIASSPITPSDLLEGSSGGLHIPVSDDSGFYGYNDEKHLQHVSVSTPTSSIVSNGYLQHRWERSCSSNVEGRPTLTVEGLRSSLD